MSGLQQLVDRRKAEGNTASHLCYSVDATTLSFMVEASNGASWVLPWQNFSSAVLSVENGRDQLVVTFPDQQVTLRGLHLALLRDAIAARSLATIRVAPSKYLKAGGPEPLVDSIQVRPTDEPPR